MRPHRRQPTRLPRPWDSYTPPKVVHTHRLPVINMSPESGVSVTFNEPTLTYHYYSKSIADVRVHSWWCIVYGYTCHWASSVASADKESSCSAGDLGSIPGLGRSPGEGKGYQLQYSGLENSMDYIVHGVAKSRTRLSDFHFTAYMSLHASTHHYGISNFTVLKIFCAVFLPFSPLNSWPPVICLWFP